ncbi:hypothetical protein [[Eubacterium] cellulosolvens]
MKNQYIEKISKSLKEAHTIIDDIRNNPVDKKTLDLKFWTLRERIEYSSAILSILNDLADFYPDLFTIPPEKDLRKNLTSIRDNVEHALHHVLDNPRFAYENLKAASLQLERIKRERKSVTRT